MKSIAKDTLAEPWQRARFEERHKTKDWHPGRVLAEGRSEFDRAGKSSWHHGTFKPMGRMPNVQTVTSASFSESRAPHLTAVDAPRVRGQHLERSGFAAGTTPLPSA